MWIHINPSTAGRVFSLLACTFNHKQDRSLEDYIETSLMLQFNGHRSKCVRKISVATEMPSGPQLRM